MLDYFTKLIPLGPVIMHNSILLQSNLLFMISNILLFWYLFLQRHFFSIFCFTPEQWEEQK